jgi:hypothetical protein
MPYQSTPCGWPPLKWPYAHFRGSCLQGGGLVAILLPPWIPNALRTWCNFLSGPFLLKGIALYSIALHCIALPCIALPCIALPCIALYCIASYRIALYCIKLHCIALYCITLHCIALYYITSHCITLHRITMNSELRYFLYKTCKVCLMLRSFIFIFSNLIWSRNFALPDSIYLLENSFNF